MHVIRYLALLVSIPVLGSLIGCSVTGAAAQVLPKEAAADSSPIPRS